MGHPEHFVLYNGGTEVVYPFGKKPSSFISKHLLFSSNLVVELQNTPSSSYKMNYKIPSSSSD